MTHWRPVRRDRVTAACITRWRAPMFIRLARVRQRGALTCGVFPIARAPGFCENLSTVTLALKPFHFEQLRRSSVVLLAVFAAALTLEIARPPLIEQGLLKIGRASCRKE